MVEELVRFFYPLCCFCCCFLLSFKSTDMKAQARLAVNSVTLGDYHRPVQIGNFIKDMFAGFQLLNLKNDILRKRSDGIKYSVCFFLFFSLPLFVSFYQSVSKDGGIA